MKTVSEWLQGVKSSPEKLNHWLRRQYIGERLAAIRVRDLAMTLSGKQQKVFLKVATDEQNHADWVLQLLVSRGIEVPDIQAEGSNFASTTRYWKHLGSGMTLESLFAAGAHAEEMRLHRIQALAKDLDVDADIQECFKAILKDERFHAKAFRKAAGEPAYEQARGNHQAGLEALGLTI
jgi:rubrerythrin